jgi:hypothetical protein
LYLSAPQDHVVGVATGTVSLGRRPACRTPRARAGLALTVLVAMAAAVTLTPALIAIFAVGPPIMAAGVVSMGLARRPRAGGR